MMKKSVMLVSFLLALSILVVPGVLAVHEGDGVEHEDDFDDGVEGVSNDVVEGLEEEYADERLEVDAGIKEPGADSDEIPVDGYPLKCYGFSFTQNVSPISQIQ